MASYLMTSESADRPARPFRALDAANDQPGALQHLEVAGNGGLRQFERFDQFHDGRFAERETSENRPSGRIGKCGKGGVEVSHLNIANRLYNIFFI